PAGPAVRSHGARRSWRPPALRRTNALLLSWAARAPRHRRAAVRQEGPPLMLVQSDLTRTERPGAAAYRAMSGHMAVNRAVARLDAWLETMRVPGGYGGPVAHWWQQSLIYVGPGLDWRYEGIIAGYCQLCECTSDERWLAKARRAGDDLMAGQLPNGHFAAS